MRCFFIFYIISASSYLFEPEAKLYMDLDPIDVFVDSLQSTKRLVSYSYSQFDLFCPPLQPMTLSSFAENLAGNLLEYSPFSLITNQNESCHFICRKTYTQTQKEILIFLIDNHYKIKMYSDNVPLTTVVGSTTDGLPVFINGYDIGFREDGIRSHGLTPGYHYITSHLNITVTFFKDTNLGTNVITGFHVVPISRPYQAPCQFEFAHSLENTSEVVFSYSVKFKLDEVSPKKRFKNIVNQHYSHLSDSSSFVISVIGAVFFIALGIFYIHQKITNYHKKLSNNDGNDEENDGFDAVKGDVFRGPHNPIMFSILVSSGIHIFTIIIVFLLLNATFCVGPARTGDSVKIVVSLYVLLAPLSGFVSIYIYILIGGLKWKKLGLLSALFENALVFFMYLIKHIISSILETHSGKLTFKRFCILGSLLLLSAFLHLSSILVVVFFRLYRHPFDHKLIPRKIPFKPIYLISEVIENVCGIVTYLIISPIVHNLLSAIWEKYIFYKLVFLTVSEFFIMIAVSSILTVFGVLLNLGRGDYEWWWMAFKAPAQTGVIVALAAMRHWMRHMCTSDQDNALYFFFNVVVFSLIVAFANGSAGFLATFFVLKKLYR